MRADYPSEVLPSMHNGDHYKGLKIEPLEYIEANGLPFHEGSIIKYVTRWRVKNGLDDLKKARSYLDRMIELEEQARAQKSTDVYRHSDSGAPNGKDRIPMETTGQG